MAKSITPTDNQEVNRNFHRLPNKQETFESIFEPGERDYAELLQKFIESQNKQSDL